MIYKSQDFVFNPSDFRDAKFIDGAALDGDQLEKGDVIIAVDRLALTANTISYGIAGKTGLIRYLDSFLTAAPYARMPFWGFGEIVASAHDDLPVGERLYGFYPLSTYVLAKMDKVTSMKCADMSPARDTIPEFYREYARSFAEPGYHPDFDDMQSCCGRSSARHSCLSTISRGTIFMAHAILSSPAPRAKRLSASGIFSRKNTKINVAPSA